MITWMIEIVQRFCNRLFRLGSSPNLVTEDPPILNLPREDQDRQPALASVPLPYHLGFVYSGSGAGGTATAPAT